jgi:flagellar basal-body rod protein FlgB
VDNTTTMRNDGNNVDIDYEMVQLVKNGLRYQVLTRLMSMNIDRYNAVLRGVR